MLYSGLEAGAVFVPTEAVLIVRITDRLLLDVSV